MALYGRGGTYVAAGPKSSLKSPTSGRNFGFFRPLFKHRYHTPPNMGTSTFSQYTVLHEESCAKVTPDAPLEKVTVVNFRNDLI